MRDRLSVVLRQGMGLLLAAAVTCLRTTPSFAHATQAHSAKAKIEKLGVGQHVMVKTTVGEELHGNITVIVEQSFKVKPDRASAEREITYSQVAKVRENPGKGVWILIAAVAVVVVVVAVCLHELSQNG